MADDDRYGNEAEGDDADDNESHDNGDVIVMTV